MFCWCVLPKEMLVWGLAHCGITKVKSHLWSFRLIIQLAGEGCPASGLCAWRPGPLGQAQAKVLPEEQQAVGGGAGPSPSVSGLDCC